MKTVTKKVKLQLVGLDGNAFFLLGSFKGWTKEEIEAVAEEAESGDGSLQGGVVMTIVQALKEGKVSRISNGDRWLFWDDSSNKEWVVLERPRHKRQNTVLVYTADEEKAVEALIKE